MNKYFRILIALAFVLGVVLLAKNNVAGAGSAGETKQSDLAQEQPSVPLAKPEPGTVKPPPSELTICKNGTYSVGGVSTLGVTDLASGYCLEAFLRNHAFALGRIPDGAGQVLAHITFLRVYQNSKFVYDIPTGDGNVEICYAVPPGMQAQIYFFNFYGPQFGKRTGQPSWEALPTSVSDGVACAPARTSGAYALIGK